MSLLTFYRDNEPYLDGATFEEVLAWPDSEWEARHDFIQWVFPTEQPSLFNPDAPLLDERLMRLWPMDPTLGANLERAHARFLSFLGIAREGGLHWQKPNPLVWGVGPNHNWLRITRCLRSLSLLGRADLARQFLDFLLQHAVTPYRVSAETVDYWKNAVSTEG